MLCISVDKVIIGLRRDIRSRIISSIIIILICFFGGLVDVVDFLTHGLMLWYLYIFIDDIKICTIYIYIICIISDIPIKIYLIAYIKHLTNRSIRMNQVETSFNDFRLIFAGQFIQTEHLHLWLLIAPTRSTMSHPFLHTS